MCAYSPRSHRLVQPCRIKAQRLPHDGKPATEIVELGAGSTPDDAYKVGGRDGVVLGGGGGVV